MTIAAPALLDRSGYEDAVRRAVAASAAYYGPGTSDLADAEYDALLELIQAYEEAHPGQVLPDSPVGKVAGGAVTGGKVRHSSVMGSLANAYDEEELTAFAASLTKVLGREADGWCVEPKLDGLAVAARYVRGTLTELITRGDGTTGESVAHMIGHLTGLPLQLNRAVTIELRGEVIMTRQQFEEANRIRVAHKAAPFRNPRNGAAGTLRAQRAYTIPMSFLAYGAPADQSSDLAEQLATLTHHQLMELLEDLGVRTTLSASAPLVSVSTIAEAYARVQEIGAVRASLDVEIDGVVVKAASAGDQRQAGYNSSRNPRFAVAFKWPTATAVTTLKGVRLSVGRTGNLTVSADLEPVDLAGTTISSATLHNPAYVDRLGLRTGDKVVVTRAAEVIPKVLAALADQRDGSEQPIQIPATCPRCDSPLDTSGEMWRCPRGRKCAPAENVIYAAGRDNLDIDGLGETLVRQLVDAGLVGDVADLFTLTREQLLGLDRMGPTSADKLLAAIESAKAQPLNRWFSALGITGTGRTASRRIANHFGTMDAIRAADAQAFAEVDGIGAEKAPVIVAELMELAELCDRLAAAGANLTQPGAATTPGDGVGPAAKPLDGLKVVVSGTMDGALAAYGRNAMNELVERAGGKASGSVSKTTSILVAGDGAGSKLTKAQELGVKVLTPQEFADMVTAFLD